MAEISGYVPCFNNSQTVVEAVRSLRAQTIPISDIFAVDDGSTDNSVAVLDGARIRVIRLSRNLGRGAARARAFEEARGELVLGCDATMRIAPEFTEKTLGYFRDDKVAGVFGRVMDENPHGVVRRWRARHLFKCHVPMTRQDNASLATWGALMRREAVLDAGNFNPGLRHSEDAELGERLKARGWNIIFAPEATVHPQLSNTLGEALERYWRWNVGTGEKFEARGFISRVSYAAKVMARLDLAHGDLPGAMISLLTPHYFVWRRIRSRR